VVTVGFDLKSADEKGRQNVLSLIIRPNADPAAAGRDVCVIVRWDIIFTTVSRIHYERPEGLRSQSIPDVLCHIST
jgi:hypothetical protein